MKLIAPALLCFLSLFIGLPQQANAQNRVGQFLKDTAKDVVLDSTTYGPFGASWLSKQLDWNSSQVLFRNGYVEDNPDFTINGLSHDKPVGYWSGNARIVRVSLPVLQLSLVNNMLTSAIERMLIYHYPEHRKFIKALGWVEKIAVSGYISYKYSHGNFRQWQINKDKARQLGYK